MQADARYPCPLLQEAVVGGGDRSGSEACRNLGPVLGRLVGVVHNCATSKITCSPQSGWMQIVVVRLLNDLHGVDEGRCYWGDCNTWMVQSFACASTGQHHLGNVFGIVRSRPRYGYGWAVACPCWRRPRRDSSGAQSGPRFRALFCLFRVETTFFASGSASLTAALTAGVDSSFSDWSAHHLTPYPKVPRPWVVCRQISNQGHCGGQ
jgi:hypothetical protein